MTFSDLVGAKVVGRKAIFLPVLLFALYVGASSEALAQ